MLEGGEGVGWGVGRLTGFRAGEERMRILDARVWSSEVGFGEGFGKEIL